MEFDLRLDNKSRMSREVHVRFREGLGVRFPRATRLVIGLAIIGVGNQPVNLPLSQHALAYLDTR